MTIYTVASYCLATLEIDWAEDWGGLLVAFIFRLGLEGNCKWCLGQWRMIVALQCLPFPSICCCSLSPWKYSVSKLEWGAQDVSPATATITTVPFPSCICILLSDILKNLYSAVVEWLYQSGHSLSPPLARMHVWSNPLPIMHGGGGIWYLPKPGEQWLSLLYIVYISYASMNHHTAPVCKFESRWLLCSKSI